MIDKLLDELHEAKYFSKLDLKVGYHQILMHLVNVEKTTFHRHDGHYDFLVMPFRLSNVRSTCKVLMNDIFWPYLRKFILVFFMIS